MAPRKFSLYVWEGVLCDYTCGIAFAIARSTEEAREQIMLREGHMPRDYYERELPDEGVQVFPLNQPVGFAAGGGG